MNREGNAISQLDYRRDFPQFPTRLPPRFPAIPNAITAAISRNSRGDYCRSFPQFPTRLPPRFPAIPMAIIAAVFAKAARCAAY
jgi:hypothetical protein